MNLDLSLVTAAGARLPLPTSRARDVAFTTGEHGYQDLTFLLPLPDAQADQLVNAAGLRALLVEGGAARWEGRVEDLRRVNGGVRVAALGDWRVLDDDLYTALWSDSRVDRWEVLSNGNVPGAVAFSPEMYAVTIDQRIQISATKGAVYANGGNLAAVSYRVPDASARAIVGIQFRLRLLCPANWSLQVRRANADISGQVTVQTITASGALIDRAYHLTFTGQPAVFFLLFNATGAASTPAGETGANYAIVSDVRVVTSTASRVSTTLTANRAAGTGPAAVATTAGMYAGQQLVINSGAALSEVVTVASVDSATQFTATFANGYTAGQTVQGHRVTADEVVRDVRDQLNALNPGALSTSNRLIVSPGIDLTDALYQDDSPQDVFVRLAAQGDTTGQRYEVGVWEGRELFFRPAGSGGAEWVVDAAEVEIEQTVDGLVNSTYGTYEDAGGRTLRTANQASPASIARYGRTRRRRVDVDTTSGALAALVAATATAATATPVPRASVRVRRFASVGGAPISGERVRAGDTVTIRNLPATAGDAAERVRRFRVAETSCDVDAAAVEIVPETPTPDVDHQIALTLRQARGGP